MIIKISINDKIFVVSKKSSPFFFGKGGFVIKVKR